jgi:hypothetical protein
MGQWANVSQPVCEWVSNEWVSHLVTQLHDQSLIQSVSFINCLSKTRFDTVYSDIIHITENEELFYFFCGYC